MNRTEFTTTSNIKEKHSPSSDDISEDKMNNNFYEQKKLQEKRQNQIMI
jgi:hypothetical protein